MHLSATAKLASRRAAKFGAGEIAYVAGLLHDLGKYNPDFQQYLLDAHAGREATSTAHAVFGALMAFERNAPSLAFPIYGHHAGMPSPAKLQQAFADPETNKTYQRVKVAAAESGWEFKPERVPEQPSVDLAGEMLLRMVFSALVDADYQDTEAHFDPERAAARTPAPGPSVLFPMLLGAQERVMLGAAGTVNEVRREVYEFCLLAASSEQGIFRLSAPTGAGKTSSALTFGLAHALEHGMDRVIFAVPYLTITDQVALVVRSIFGAENVIEHHSGVLSREPSWRNRLRPTTHWARSPRGSSASSAITPGSGCARTSTTSGCSAR
jgi:CRISPR-associated endonuclease/helicase Cas3